MDRYQRVEKPRAESPMNENEIHITTQGGITLLMPSLSSRKLDDVRFDCDSTGEASSREDMDFLEAFQQGHVGSDNCYLNCLGDELWNEDGFSWNASDNDVEKASDLDREW
ncbi:hypothetical protein POM88_007587 [Heracleum sosnowskyi]|uniref:Uncharacterized protein n=1 Tax=Heracleum sosnowskyi TaxID=360622 RepID=A0AAD8J6G3_9APIA|nr:hypothetical protein POM88_007587 [Heracleum sosnowskyi]